MAIRLALGMLVLWAATVTAEPYGCLDRTGRLRLLATSPAVCSPGETPLGWEAETVSRPGRAAARPVPSRQVGTAALLAVFLLPRVP